jgi:hypothetical protein
MVGLLSLAVAKAHTAFGNGSWEIAPENPLL